ncbi:FmdB family zinc ribbon protein [Glaciibacter psychrotolerans]|uniref:Putative FmdB family regulatory protein n=1 Tax=Glaciibacter psychrotolerans TaxID=670054 RepID=A0A7Z0EAY0_9MICO|nr:putative FmdB family regulatory protein [Leifsonia psychrotolerans]
MPTYSYRCTACDTAFDIQQAFTDNSLTECPTCGGKLRKVFSSIGVTFNGSGFYRNDARSDAKLSAKSAASATGSASGSPSGSAAKSTPKEGSASASVTSSSSASTTKSAAPSAS